MNEQIELSEIWEGDCLSILPDFPESSIDVCITDPPYHIGNGIWGYQWDKGDLSFNTNTWNVIHRVLKPGAYLAAMGATRLYHRLAVAIEDAGFEITDTMAYLFGTGVPKSNSSLRAGWEPIVVARKPVIGSIKQNHEVYGTGRMNIDDARTNLANDDFVATFKYNYESYKTGTSAYNRVKSDGVRTDKGRWPNNVVHDGSEAVLDSFPNRENARFFYTSKPSPRERDAGLKRIEDVDKTRPASERRSNNHPTLKPIELIRWIVRLLTPANGIVLDPFIGSGTTAIAALLEDRRCIGIEQEEQYIEVAMKRFDFWEKQIETKGKNLSVKEYLK